MSDPVMLDGSCLLVKINPLAYFGPFDTQIIISSSFSQQEMASQYL
jgi:hypothetical protein